MDISFRTSMTSPLGTHLIAGQAEIVGNAWGGWDLRTAFIQDPKGLRTADLWERVAIRKHLYMNGNEVTRVWRQSQENAFNGPRAQFRDDDADYSGDRYR
jgi:hypothetical protein